MSRYSCILSLQEQSSSRRVDSLDDHCCSSASTITYRRTAILPWLQLVQQSSQDPGTGAAQCVAQGDGAAEEIDFSLFESKDLRMLAMTSKSFVITDLFVCFDDSGKRFVEFPNGNILLLQPSTLKSNRNCLGRCYWEINRIDCTI